MSLGLNTLKLTFLASIQCGFSNKTETSIPTKGLNYLWCAQIKGQLISGYPSSTTGMMWKQTYGRCLDVATLCSECLPDKNELNRVCLSTKICAKGLRIICSYLSSLFFSVISLSESEHMMRLCHVFIMTSPLSRCGQTGASRHTFRLTLESQLFLICCYHLLLTYPISGSFIYSINIKFL